MLKLLRDYGFEEFEAELATRPDKFVGDPADWDEAEELLRQAVEASGIPYVIAEGEGAFYAPKIDVHVRDAIGRRWQLSTLQVDFQFADRFDLEYVGTDNQRHRPRIIHRALFGSFDRFFGVLLEHTAGRAAGVAGPGAGAGAARALRPRGPRARAWSTGCGPRASGPRWPRPTSRSGARIRKAKLEKIPHVVVVGDDDVADDTVGDNPRGGEVERGVPVATFIERLRTEVAAHA